MEFGVGCWNCDKLPGDDRPHSELYQEMLEEVQVAEENNFDCVWTTEHHFTDGGYMPSQTSALAAMAAVTDEIDIGTNIALGPQYKQPVRLAEDLAVIDNISEGRVRFGVGNGYRVEEFEGFDVPLDQRALRLENLIEILRKAWSEGEIEHDAHPALECGYGCFSFEEINVTPKPHQEDGPPIIIGGFAPPAIERAGRMGDGFTIGSLVGFEEAKGAVDLYWDSVDEADKNPDEQELVVWNFAFLTDGGDAEGIVEDGWQHTLDQYGEWYHNAGMIEEPDELHAGFNEVAMYYDDPDRMIEEIERYQEHFSDDFHFVFQAAQPCDDSEELKRSMELFGQEVIPSFN